MGDILKKIFSDSRFYVYWVESLVILAIVVFILYLSYSLNLFKKG